MKLSEPVVVARRIDSTKRLAAGKRIAANIRRLQKTRGTRTARQALAEARGEAASVTRRAETDHKNCRIES